MTTSIVRRFENFIQEWDKDSDEVVEQNVYNEYYNLLNLTQLYPSLKTRKRVIAHLGLFIFSLLIYVQVMFVTFMSALNSDGDFILMIHSLHLCFIHLLTCLMLIAVNMQRSNFAQLHKIIANGFYIYENETISRKEIQIILKYRRIKRILKIIFPIISLSGGVTSFLTAPSITYMLSSPNDSVYNKNGVNLWLPLNGWYPFDTSYRSTYWLAFILQMMGGSLVIFTVISASSIYFTIVLHIIIQYEILILSVKNITKRTMANYLKTKPNLEKKYRTRPNFEDIEFQKQMEYCLKQNIQHYLQIIRAVKLLEEMLSFICMAIFLSGAFILALSAIILVSIQKANPSIVVMTLIFAVSEITHFTAVCKLGQMLTDLNDQLSFEFYNVPWYYCSKDFKRCVNISQTRAVVGMAIKTLFNFVISMDTYSQLLNTSYSYFSLLLAFKST